MLWVLITVFLLAMFLGMPIAFAMAVSAALTFIVTPDMNSIDVGIKMYSAMDSFSLMAIPFFMFAGELMNDTGITEKIIKFARSLVGSIRGGLGHATVITGVILAGVSGSADADTAAISSLMVPALEKEGYDRGFSCALTAACGNLGPIIPPSIMMVIYAGVTSISIAELFMAGVIPGLIMAVGFSVLVVMHAKKNNIEKDKFGGWRVVGKTFVQTIWALIMPVIIIGGISSGAVTATEAGALAVFYALVYGFISKTLNGRILLGCIKNAAKNATGPMIIIAFASLFGYVLTYNNLSRIIETAVLSFTTSGTILYFIIFIIIFIAGMFIDPTAILLMVVPIFLPMIKTFGLDPIHFAMVCLLSLCTGGMSPPVGMLLYITSSATGTDLSRVIRHCWGFLLVGVIVIFVVIFFPALVTFLPTAMYG